MIKERRKHKPGKRRKCHITKGKREEAGKGEGKKPQPDLIDLLPHLEGKRAILTVLLEKGGENGAEE